MAIELIYWDSATFLAYFQKELGRYENCHDTLERAEIGNVGIVTSSLSIAECLWLRGENKIPKEKAEIIQKFFRKSFIRVRNVTRKTAELAQKLVWEYNIRPKDAIHVATAIEEKVTIIETFDEFLISKSGIIEEKHITIRNPMLSAQQNFSF